MKQRWWLVGGFDLWFEYVSAMADGDELVLDVTARHTVHDQLDELLASAFQPYQLAFGRSEAGALLHAKPVHLLRELATEFLEEILAHQLVFKSAENAFFDFLPRNRQAVRARATTTRTEASQVLARVHDETGSALAAFCQTGEQVLWSPELVESARFLC